MTNAPFAVPSFSRGNDVRGMNGGVANRALASRIQTLTTSPIRTARQTANSTIYQLNHVNEDARKGAGSRYSRNGLTKPRIFLERRSGECRPNVFLKFHVSQKKRHKKMRR